MPEQKPLPLRAILLYWLFHHPDGLRPVECWESLMPRPAYSTVTMTLGKLCRQGLAVRMARGRYTLHPFLRHSLEAHQGREATV